MINFILDSPCGPWGCGAVVRTHTCKIAGREFDPGSSPQAFVDGRSCSQWTTDRLASSNIHCICCYPWDAKWWGPGIIFGRALAAGFGCVFCIYLPATKAQLSILYAMYRGNGTPDQNGRWGRCNPRHLGAYNPDSSKDSVSGAHISASRRQYV